MKRFPIRNAVSFHSSIDKAKRNKELQTYITDSYDYQPIDTFTVSGKVPTTKRNEIVQEFARSERSLITNARCLTEGVDVPNIDCIVFADPRKSKVDIVQALGRALRKKKGKDWGYVVLPVIYNEETGEIDNDNFNEILAVVRGLASNDERIIEHFKDKNQSDKNRKTSDSGGQFQFEVFSDRIDESQLTEQLDIRLWEKLVRFLRYEDAKKFVQELKFQNTNEWREWCKTGQKPVNIPSAPNLSYTHSGWVSWSDWLGSTNTSNWDKAFLPFEDARILARSLSLKSESEWRSWCISGKRPKNIPASPSHSYKDSGWIGWRDWLKQPTHIKHATGFLTYSEARNFIRQQKLNSHQAWLRWKRTHKYFPSDLPKAPDQVYKNKGWSSWGGFLGTENVSTREIHKGPFRSFYEARDFAQSLGLKSRREWSEFALSDKCPTDIPRRPERFYSELEWKGYDDWLNSGRIRTSEHDYLDFKEARELVRNRAFASYREYLKVWDSEDLGRFAPKDPRKYYSESGWIDGKDWVRLPISSFEDARQFVQSLGLKSGLEWREYCKSGDKPKNIPSDPSRKYNRTGWIGMNDWLGNGKASLAKTPLSYSEAMLSVRALKLSSAREYREEVKAMRIKGGKTKMHLLPINPNTVYRGKGWSSWGDFLGTGRVADMKKKFLPFEEAREVVRGLGLKTQSDWRAYSKKEERPKNIPTSPGHTYRNKGWAGYSDWLGNGRKRNADYKSFSEARKFAQSLGLPDWNAWAVHYEKGDVPNDIPKYPMNTYSQEYKGIGDWLGTGVIAKKDRTFKDYQAAKKYVVEAGVKTSSEWQEWSKSGKRPNDIPGNPQKVYKNKGWISWPHFLSKK